MMDKIYFITPGKMKLYLGQKCKNCGRVNLSEFCRACASGFIRPEWRYTGKIIDEIEGKECPLCSNIYYSGAEFCNECMMDLFKKPPIFQHIEDSKE